MKKCLKGSYVCINFETPIEASLTYKIEDKKATLEELHINSNGYLSSTLNKMIKDAKKEIKPFIT